MRRLIPRSSGIASTQRNAIAQSTIGNMYYNGQNVEQNYTEAVRLYRLAADQGYVPAQYNLRK